MKKLIPFVALAVLTLPAAASAQQSVEQVVATALRPLMGTTSVTAEEQRSEGKLLNCYMEFSHLAQDWTYKQGNFIRVGGSVGMMAVKNAIGVTLKVIVHDIHPRTMDLTPSPPASAYFASGNKSSRLFFVNSTESDTPGGLFSIFKFEAAELLMDALSKDEITIAFNRRKGGVDLKIPIDLSIQDTKKDGTKVRTMDTANKFSQCVLDLIGAMQAQNRIR